MPRGGTLSRISREYGNVVPLPWPWLRDLVKPRAGYVVVVLGAQGQGKSTAAVQWAYSLNTPSLVISLDTDIEFTQTTRVIAMHENKTTDEVEQEIEKDPDLMRYYLDRYSPLVRWSAREMYAEDLDELLVAEKEFFGVVPSLVVVDSMGDVVRDEDYQSYIEGFRTLKRAAMKHKTCVVALHHIGKGDKKSGVGAGGIQFSLSEALFGNGRGSQIVLGMWSIQGGHSVFFSILKNRMGQSDPSGSLNRGFGADLSRARIGDLDSVPGYTTSFRKPA